MIHVVDLLIIKEQLSLAILALSCNNSAFVYVCNLLKRLRNQGLAVNQLNVVFESLTLNRIIRI